MSVGARTNSNRVVALRANCLWLGFVVYFTPKDGSKPETAVVEHGRVPSDTAREEGWYTAEVPGSFRLVWDNKHSYFTSKLLKYSVVIEQEQ